MKVQVTYVNSRPNEMFENVKEITHKDADIILLHLETGEIVSVDTSKALTKIIQEVNNEKENFVFKFSNDNNGCFHDRLLMGK